MKIAIIGYGLQGESAYHYWSDPANQITVCDSNSDLRLPPDVQRQLGPDYLNGLEDFDLIVRSPIVHPRTLVAASSPQILDKVTTVTNEFFKVCPSHNIIGVTGTKGKGTTSTLITKMLEAAGCRAHLGGNIGTPPLDLLSNGIRPDDWAVLELANFQLIDLRYSPKIAVCLMVVPEHLDWHDSMAEYMETKSQLFSHQLPEDTAIYFSSSDNSKQIASHSPGKKVPYFAPPGAIVEQDHIKIDGQIICRTDELKLLGKHNWQNVCAAVTAVWQISHDTEAIRSVLTSFSGLEHRLELIRELSGVKYYDDSFGTTPETAIVAVQAFSQPKVLILGGSDKGAEYDELAQAVVNGNVKCVLLIGQQADRIQAALERVGYQDFMPGGANMDEIVTKARTQTTDGDIVLLSTACASFDMFKNYKDRGQQFKRAVQSLA